MLRDRLVCGIRDKRIQQRLLAEPELTFQKARELALAAETATRNSQDLQANKTPITTNTEPLLKIQRQRKTLKSSTDADGATACYRCGGTTSQRIADSEKQCVGCARREATLPEHAVRSREESH